MFGRLRTAWKGELPLWEAYWVWGVLVNNLLIYTLEWLLAPLLEEETADEVPALNEVILLMLALCLCLAYCIFSCVAVWRCAPNTNLYVWTFLARAMVVLGICIATYGIYTEFAKGLDVVP